MKVIQILIFAPLYCFSFLLGIISRPIVCGFLDGYIYLEINYYKDLYKKYGNSNTESGESERNTNM